MKRVFIGDIHGRDWWEDILAKEQDADEFIFIGDYFDSYDPTISPSMEIDNFKRILEYKKENPEDITLLFGNHDFHYLEGISDRYSRYIFSHWEEISKLITDTYNSKLFKLAYTFDNVIVTHAGLSKTWCRKMLGNDTVGDLNVLTNELNAMLMVSPKNLLFDKGQHISFSGDDVTQSPIWIRPHSMLIDRLVGVGQIVGHTRMVNIVNISETDDILYLVDALEEKQYLVVEDGEYNVKELK